jgi:DNA-binding PadR family transcriptional regulator
MYADNTLTPKEATRLCALGMLADGPMAYAELAAGVRHFVTHVMGPSLDVLGTSIELLKHEGLVTALSGEKDKAILQITPDGLAELRTLLTARIKTAENDLNKLVIALKFRFMDFLDPGERLLQIDLLTDSVENELARLEDLRAHHSDDSVHLVEWLDREIEDLERRIVWLKAKRERV